MGFNFQKLPVNTLIGADWKTFHEATAGRKIDKGYKNQISPHQGPLSYIKSNERNRKPSLQ